LGDIQGLFKSVRVTVTDVPSMIADSSLGQTSIIVKNLTKVSVCIGGDSTVTFTNGYPLGLNENLSIGFAERSFQIAGFHKSEIWAVCDTGTSTTLAILAETKVKQSL